VKRLLGTVALAGLAATCLVACVPRGDEVSCNDRGCSSVVQLSGIDLGSVAEVRMCGAGRCVTRSPSIGGTVNIDLPEDVSGGDGGELEVQVTLVLGRGGEVTGPPATLDLIADFPNGEACPPPCWVAAASIGADGTLTPTEAEVAPPGGYT
jgi:hypothetical protein